MERDQQLQFDKTIEKIHMELVDRAGSNVQGGGIYERIRLWINPRIELHIPFEQIPNEKKNLISLALKTSILLFNTFV